MYDNEEFLLDDDLFWITNDQEEEDDVETV